MGDSNSAASSVAALRQRLTPYPNVSVSEDEDCIRIHPGDADGFEVALLRDDADWVVHFDGWCEHFPTLEEAIECVLFGLSPSCRVKIIYRGSFAASWTVEALESGRWIPFGSTGHLLFPFWHRPRTEYRQNRLVPAAQAKE